MTSVFTNSFTEFTKEKFPDASFSDKGLPLKYTSFEGEYHSLSKGAGLRNISFSPTFVISGKDSFDYLNRISTNKIENLQTSEKVNTLFTTEKGRVIDRTILLRYDEHLLLIGNAAAGFKLKHWLDRFIISEDIQIEEVTGKYTILEVTGPQSASYLTLLCGSVIDTIDDKKTFFHNTHGVYFHLLKFTEHSGIVKYWIVTAMQNSEALYNLLFNQSIFDLNLVGEEAYEVFRVEKGIPVSPNEINDNFNPHELKLTGEISGDKGCYIGQEVIARLETYDKVQRELCGIVFNGEKIFDYPLFLFDKEGNEAAVVTSVVKSELVNATIGLALVRKKSVTVGSEVELKSGNGINFKVKITGLPFTR